MLNAIYVGDASLEKVDKLKGNQIKMQVNLVLAGKDNEELIHQMKYDAFLSIYEKNHDEETNPLKEKLEKVVQKILDKNSAYYLINFQNKYVGAISVVRRFP